MGNLSPEILVRLFLTGLVLACVYADICWRRIPNNITLGGIGDGDVKMLAAIGAWVGAESLLWIALYTALTGGLLAVAVLLIRKKPTRFREILSDILVFSVTRKRCRTSQGAGSFPYSLAIAGGWLTFQFVGKWGA